MGRRNVFWAHKDSHQFRIREENQYSTQNWHYYWKNFLIMKTQLFTTLFWGSLLFLVSCSNKSDYQPFVPSLPPITQTGANTFGCYIDGVLLTPRDGTGGLYGTPKGMVFSGSGDPPNYTYNEIRTQDYT